MVDNFFDDSFSQHSKQSKSKTNKKEDEASDKKKIKVLKEALQDERKAKAELQTQMEAG